MNDPERDLLLAKVKNQRDRINYLEGATHHANGTPLSIALARVQELEAESYRPAWLQAMTERDRYRESLQNIIKNPSWAVAIAKESLGDDL